MILKKRFHKGSGLDNFEQHYLKILEEIQGLNLNVIYGLRDKVNSFTGNTTAFAQEPEDSVTFRFHCCSTPR